MDGRFFASLEEEAAFWDSHSLGEFEDEWEPVEFEVARPLLHQFAVRLEGPDFHRLLEIAKQRGLPASALAAELIREGIERSGAAVADGAAEATVPE